MAERKEIVSPFLRRGFETRGMMNAVTICLFITAAVYAVRVDPAFAWRFPAYIAFAFAVDLLYFLLKDGRWRAPRASTAVTAALLALSVPARMPWWQTGSGILVAVLFAKRMADPAALRLNPMLLGRLFLMIVFPNEIQQWEIPGRAADALTSATPLGLYAMEGETWSALKLLSGQIRGVWGDGLYAIIPGSPGDVFPPLTVAAGIALYMLGVLDWRPIAAFIAAFAVTAVLLGMPLPFHLAAGSLLFSAVYIVTDMRSMPGSKAGRLMAGGLAGILNALVRHHGYYPEGIVMAVLTVNLLSPALDRLAFNIRGWRLARRQDG